MATQLTKTMNKVALGSINHPLIQRIGSEVQKEVDETLVSADHFGVIEFTVSINLQSGKPKYMRVDSNKSRTILE